VHDLLDHVLVLADAPVKKQAESLALGVVADTPARTFFIFLISWHRAARLEFLPISVPLIVCQYVAIKYGLVQRRAIYREFSARVRDAM